MNSLNTTYRSGHYHNGFMAIGALFPGLRIIFYPIRHQILTESFLP